MCFFPSSKTNQLRSSFNEDKINLNIQKKIFKKKPFRPGRFFVISVCLVCLLLPEELVFVGLWVIWSGSFYRCETRW